ncbi:hypothetical protein [Sphingomonas sp.]|uniref:hypothetical protein n=1 Tax=Sphingomonas sp. TaxID=28214 RepID=UPI003D6CF29C
MAYFHFTRSPFERRAARALVSPAAAVRFAVLIVLAATAVLFFVQVRAVLDDPMPAAMLTLVLAIPLTSLLRGPIADRRRP